MRRLKQLLVFCIGFLWLVCTNVQADVYRWVDDKGQVHYGDKLPKGISGSAIDMPKVEPSVAPSVNDAERRQRQQKIIETLSTERKEREDARKEAREKKVKLKADCEKFKRRLVESESIHRYYRRNEKGERVYMTDKERVAADNKRKQQYNERCAN